MIEILDPRDIPEWNQKMSAFSGCSVFHSREWMEVLYDTYNYQPSYVVSSDGFSYDLVIPFLTINSILTGHRGVSLPFTDFCQPLGPGRIGKPVLEKIEKHGKEAGWKYYEIRGDVKSNASIPPSIQYLGHVLDLTHSLDIVYNNFRPTTRRNIHKARRKKIKVDFYHDMKAVREFYRLNCLTRRRHGLPPQPFSFFQNIQRHLLKKGLGYVILAKYNDKIVAGLVLLTFAGKAIYKFGASDPKFKNTNANYTLIWEVIQKSVEDKIESLHFGRTHPQAKGLIQFKKGWGTTTHSLNYYRFSFKKNDFVQMGNQETGFHNFIFRSLNLGLLKLIGRILYPHLG